jgi:hypothetical protein
MIMVEAKAGIRVRLVVKDADGNVTSDTTKDDDLATNQFLKWMVEQFKTTFGASTYTLVDRGGTTRTITSRLTNSPGTWTQSNHMTWLGLGDGSGSTVTPARTNINLVNTLAGGPHRSWTSIGVNSVSSAVSVVNTTGSSFTVREVGFFYEMDGNLFLFFHDSVTATTVSNGSTATVSYDIQWP